MESTALPDIIYLTPEDVAEYFNVSVKTVYNWCDQGILESKKLGGRIRIKRKDVIEFENKSDRFGISS